MKKYTRHVDELSIVLIGNFNPSIFQPEWFLRHEFVGESDLSSSSLRLDVIHKDVAQFKTSWFSIEVINERFMLTTSDMSKAEQLRDLVVNIFQTLSETPISALGINKTARFKCSDVNSWHKVGRILAPNKLWLSVSSNPSASEDSVGMRSLEVEIKRSDELEGCFRVSVFPSSPLPYVEVGIRVNDHIDYKLLSGKQSNLPIAELIQNYWDKSIENSDRLIDNLFDKLENHE